MSATIKVMCDLETLSTKNNAAILSIALVPFDTVEPFESIYLKIDPGGYNWKPYFHLDEGTKIWWDQQSQEARTEAFSGTLDIVDALVELSTYISSLPLPIELWGNGATFDNVILKSAYDLCRLELPWSYKHDRCYRTLAALVPEAPVQPFEGTEHNALADAKNQAAHAENIFKYLRGDFDPAMVGVI